MPDYLTEDDIKTCLNCGRLVVEVETSDGKEVVVHLQRRLVKFFRSTGVKVTTRCTTRAEVDEE